MQRKVKAFTLVELMTVVLIISIIAAFGIPSYNRSRQKSQESNVVSNLRIMARALEIYRERNGSYPPPGSLDNAGEISSTLNIHINEFSSAAVGYSCFAGLPNAYTCRGSTGQFYIVITSGTHGNPRCVIFPCPSCPGGWCWYD